jgi:hypothetical protein
MDILGSIRSDLVKGRNINIIFIGDSITSTEWVHPNWREMIEYVLKEELTRSLGSEKWKIPSWGIRCHNCGFDGSTTADILDMMDKRILSLKPDVAIYIANTNEIHLNKDLAEYKKDVKSVVDALSKKCRAVMLANSIAGDSERYNKEYGPYAGAIRSLKLSKTIFIDLYSAFQAYNLEKFFTFTSGGNQVLGIAPGQKDFVHPNQLGNAYIAKIILEKGFGIRFDPEKYIKDTLKGEMYPGY